jgi:hypothetical protein
MLLVIALLAAASRSAQSQAPAECFDGGRAVQSLTASQLAAVNRGGAVVTTTDLSDHRWPRVCVYQYIDAQPEQSLAVLVDYPLRPSYIPDVKASNVVPPTADSTTKRVAYLIHVLLRINETDTLREVPHALDAPIGGYRLEWSSLFSSMAKSIAGSATFVPWRKDSTSAAGTLMIYQQLVEPGSSLAGLPFIKSRGIDAVRNAAVAIAHQVENERRSQPRQIEQQVAELRRTLSLPYHGVSGFTGRAGLLPFIRGRGPFATSTSKSFK